MTNSNHIFFETGYKSNLKKLKQSWELETAKKYNFQQVDLKAKYDAYWLNRPNKKLVPRDRYGNKRQENWRTASSGISSKLDLETLYDIALNNMFKWVESMAQSERRVDITEFKLCVYRWNE